MYPSIDRTKISILAWHLEYVSCSILLVLPSYNPSKLQTQGFHNILQWRGGYMYLDTRQVILHFRKVDVHCIHHDVSLEYWQHVFSKYYAQCYIPLLHYFTANVMTVCLQGLGISVCSNIRVLRRSIYKVKNQLGFGLGKYLEVGDGSILFLCLTRPNTRYLATHK